MSWGVGLGRWNDRVGKFPFILDYAILLSYTALLLVSDVMRCLCMFKKDTG